MAMGTCELVCCTDSFLCAHDGPYYPISTTSAVLPLAIWWRSVLFYRDGRRRHVDDLSGQTPVATASAEDVDGLRICCRHSCGRLDPGSAGYLENSSDPHVVTGKHRRERSMFHAALLDL